MENNRAKRDEPYRKLVFFFLKLLLIVTSLCAYKYIYNFRINQEASLRLFTFLLLTIWLIKMVNTGKIIFKRTGLDLPLILYVLVLLVSISFSKSKMVSFQEWLLFFSYIILFYSVSIHIENQKDFNGFINLFFMISFLVSAYALLQYYGFDPYLSDLGKISSTIGQKNWISNYLAMIFPILFAYFLLEEKAGKKMIFFLLLSVFFATLIICQSNGILISIFLTLLLAIFIIVKFRILTIFIENKRWLILLFLVFFLIAALYSTKNPLNKSTITLPQVAASTFDKQNFNLNTRLLHWRATIEMIKESPVFGLGIGSYKLNYLDYQARVLDKNPHYIEYSGKASEAHNEYLQMWAEVGVIGLVIFLAIILIFYFQFWKYFRREKGIEKVIVAWGLILGINAFLMHSLLAFPLHVPALGSVFFVLLGLGTVYIHGFRLLEENRPLKKIHFAVRAFLTGVILIAMMFSMNILVIKPYLAEIYYFAGMRHNVSHHYSKSLPIFQYAAELDPYNGRNLHALGVTYFHLQKIPEAIDALQRAKVTMTDVNTFRILGTIYLQAGENERAEDELKRAIYLDPKNIQAYNELASLYIHQNEYEKAIDQWKKAMELNPDFAERYLFVYYIGMAYQQMGENESAQDYFLQALRETPENSPVLEDIKKELMKIDLNSQ
jgi:O-antigen ligase/cytochrome c-type biogenesis protein CcmH/NrfG